MLLGRSSGCQEQYGATVLNRRHFLTAAAMALSCASTRAIPTAKVNTDPELTDGNDSAPKFESDDAQYQATYARALDVLDRNTTILGTYPGPVLIEGSTYGGIWQECAPQEGLAYSHFRPDSARNNHLAFFSQQRGDGQLPCWLRKDSVGFGQIQMVVPIAATAWELSQRLGDSELLQSAYVSSSRWDLWLRRYRDTRQTGLCEGFCTYDTGHDNSPRWVGIPNRCPDADARKCPPLASLPRLCPDLSATIYGGRVALAAMARALGKAAEADRWLDQASEVQAAIMKRLYVPEDAAFYDIDAQDHVVRIRSDVVSRVVGEHVVAQNIFEDIYSRQIHNPSAFWATYPLPSIALDDPTFVRPIPRNSWGGASQALTALRAPRWLEHYGKPADLAYLMQQWVHAILRDPRFLQQLDPNTGAFTPDLGDYSPAALVFVDFTWRLSGVRQIGDELEWNLRPGTNKSSFRVRVSPTMIAELGYTSEGARMSINDRTICRSNQPVRIVTDHRGSIKRAIGISGNKTRVSLKTLSEREHRFWIKPNEVLSLTSR